jgi:hypothetical protein
MDDEFQLRDIQQQLARAWVERDRAFIERILAPEWSVTQANGSILSRANVLRSAFETEALQVKSMVIDDVTLSISAPQPWFEAAPPQPARTRTLRSMFASDSPTCSSRGMENGKRSRLMPASSLSEPSPRPEPSHLSAPGPLILLTSFPAFSAEGCSERASLVVLALLFRLPK